MPHVHYKKELPKKYNPQNTTRQVLIDTFAIRLKEYNKIWDALRQAKMEKPEEHFIVQGVRGSGKTTLLTRLAYAIEDDKKLSKKLIAVQLKEEEYGISTLFSLWLRIAEDLEEHYQYASQFEGLVDEIEALEMEDGAEAKAAFRLINKKLEKNNKKIILLVDNIVELFDNFSDDEKAMLREVLSQNPNLRIVGGSAIALESFYDHKDPFYQFFKVITLKSLTKTETIKLLKTLGKAAGEEELQKINAVIKNESEKIESIRRLTGGIPRTIVLLFEILAEGPKGTTFQILDDTLDMASPIYKHRMDDLTKQQKPIIHAIAQHWDAISAKEIAKKTRLSSKNISAQLAQLQKQWLIESIKTDTKNNLYRLQERFFNIWYLMRYGRRRDKKKMHWLTQFLEIWCTPDELKEKARCYAKELNGDVYLPGTLHYTKALMNCSSLGVEEKETVYHHAEAFFKEKGRDEFLNELPGVGGKDYYKQAKQYYDNKDYKKTINYLKQAIQKGLYKAYLDLGNIYAGDLKDYPKAEEAYRKAIEKGVNDAYLNLGVFYADNLKDYPKAEKVYRQAIEKGVNEAYVNLGVLYAVNLKDYPKAEEVFLQAIEKGVKAYFNLGNLYALDLNNYPKAEKAYRQAMENGDYKAYFNLGNLYADKLNDYPKAEEAYQQAIEKGVYDAYVNLGVLYADDLKNYPKAEEAFLQAIEKGVNEAYFNLGHLYANDLKDYPKAEEAYQQAIEKGVNEAYFNLGYLYANYLKDYPKAEKAYRQAIEKGINRAYSYLSDLYIEKQNNLPKAEKLFKEGIDNQIDFCLNNLAWLYFEQKAQDKKEEAIKLACQSIERDKGFSALHTFISIALWNTKLKEAEKYIHALLKMDSWKECEWEQKNLIDLFLLFLAKGQTNLVDRLLKEYELTDILKPLYYTLMHLMKDKYPNEYLRMGAEMQETVDEMLAKIKMLRKDYK